MPPFANLLAALSAQSLHALAPGAASGDVREAGRYDPAEMAPSAAPAALPSLLVVDDEPELRGLLAEYFGRHGFEVRMAEGAAQARELIAAARPDLAVLDINMPGENGLSLARWLREAHPRVAIVMLTTASEAVDRIVGLELGADDYIAKPSNPRELLARIKAIHRRMQLGAPGAPVRYLRFAGFSMDVVERVLSDARGEPVVLTSMDFNLLRFFAEHAGETLDRSRLMEQTRGRDLGPLDRSLDVQISRLRQRLNDDGKQPVLIKTVRGLGYVFSADVSAHGDL